MSLDTESICVEAEEMSEKLSLTWSTVASAVSGQCASHLGIWSCVRGGVPKFVPGAWEWTSDELLAVIWGKCLLEHAMEQVG